MICIAEIKYNKKNGETKNYFKIMVLNFFSLVQKYINMKSQELSLSIGGPPDFV